ncbi:MAG: HAMP domain-containing sensor histidine kinase [Leptolyngbyaceae cyanobacterium bins.349]|nr:HAMP domain-containing sensor histidine kinase [Leptolyngbyaceae cyanobacterium bins.349]
MSQFPLMGSIPPLPHRLDVDPVDEADDVLAQLLYQENQVLREQIAHHTQLLQLLTHQLATPLTTLSGSVHLLAEPDLADEERREFLGLVEQQIRRLQDLLNDMMALQDLETGRLAAQPTQFCLRQLVMETMQDFAPYPALYHFAEALPQVWGDRWQVSQVLTNLFSNAIKYSPNGHPIEIGAAVVQPEWVEIWVQDHGLGIPLADQPHLFERFYRVKHRDRQHIAGTGLGLSLCKLLVENQGGQMGFESTHGQGSRFYFTLPMMNWAER